MKEREGKGNGPYKGPSGIGGEITGHKEMREDGRRRKKKGNIQGRPLSPIASLPLARYSPYFPQVWSRFSLH
jgi:hypothetical protein